MTEDTNVEIGDGVLPEAITKPSILAKSKIQNGKMLLWALIYAVIGALFYVGISLLPTPYTMVGILKFGFIPAIAIIVVVGAFKGPIAGFLTGYLGELLYGLLVYNVVVTMTLPAMAYGILGLVVGLATYDFTSGRSLLKLSVLSVVGFVLTVLLTLVIGISVEGYSPLVAIAFSMLPLFTMGIPTALLLPPVISRFWHIVTTMIKSDLLTE